MEHTTTDNSKATTLYGHYTSIPGTTWGKRFNWYRNADGTVTVSNTRTGSRLRYPNVGEAMRAARETKRSAAMWSKCLSAHKRTVAA